MQREQNWQILWGWKENVLRGSEKRPVLGRPSWCCLNSKRSWRGKQRPDWQGLAGIIKESDIFPMKLANHQDILISSTEEQNWKLFVYLCWQSVLENLGRLQLSQWERYFSTQMESTEEDWELVGYSDYVDLGIYSAPSLTGCDLNQVLSFLEFHFPSRHNRDVKFIS